MTQAIRTARGSAPMPCAMLRQMGTIRAVVAVLDMKVGHDAAEQEDHQSQDVGRGILAQSTNDDVCNLCACPGLIQCRGQRQRTTEEEDGLEVDGLQGVFLGDDTGEDQSQRTDTACDVELDADLLFKNHAQQGEHEDDEGEHLFPLGNIAEVLLAAEGVIIGDGVVGQQLHAKGGVEEDADGEDGQAHDGVLKEAEGHPDLTRALWAMRLPGAPMRERLPPMAAANTSGISSLERA